MRFLRKAAAVALTATASAWPGGVLAQALPMTIRAEPVNDPAADTTDWNTQTGPALIDLGGGKLVAAWYDSGSYDPTTPLKQHFTGYAYSSDSGVGWTDAGKIPDFLPPAQQEGEDLFTGPALAAHRASGIVYLATTGRAPTQNILVYKSADSGHTFAAPVSGSPGYAGGDIQYKPRIAVDNLTGTGSGNVYLCWSRYPSGAPSEVRFSRSTDAGASFSPNLGTLVAAGDPGCHVTVSPGHQVNVFYLHGTDPFGGGDNRLFLRRSLDRGTTFEPEVLVADLQSTSIWGDLGLSPGVRSNSFPQVAVNPVAGRPYLYVFFNDDRTSGDEDHGDVFYVSSKDGGVTWSAPRRVNDDLDGDQFYPSAAFVDAGERILASYYSCSHDPDGRSCHRRARSGVLNANGVIAWDPSFQLGPDTPLGWTGDPYFFDPGFLWLGDYNQAAGGDGAVSLAWSDNRARDDDGNPDTDIHFARIPLPPASTNLSLTAIASSSTIKLGRTTTLTVTAQASTGPANDVFVHLSPTFGLGYLTVTPAAGGSCTNLGQFVDCSLGRIGAGKTKRIKVQTAGVYSAGTRAVTATASTSSKDTTTASAALRDTASVIVETTPPAESLTHTFEAQDLPITVAPGHSEKIRLPIAISGNVIRITAYVRLIHPRDEEVGLDLVRNIDNVAALKVIHLSYHNGGSSADYGSGPNDCSGTRTVFDDGADRSIAGGIAPFAGTYRPDEPLASLERGPLDVPWALVIFNDDASDDAVIGCFRLKVVYEPT